MVLPQANSCVKGVLREAVFVEGVEEAGDEGLRGGSCGGEEEVCRGFWSGCGELLWRIMWIWRCWTIVSRVFFGFIARCGIWLLPSWLTSVRQGRGCSFGFLFPQRSI